MLDKFLTKTDFSSYEDFMNNFNIEIPENFNFGYDVVDAWAEKEPEKKALCWTNDNGEYHQFTFGEIKEKSDQTASYFSH